MKSIKLTLRVPRIQVTLQTLELTLSPPRLPRFQIPRTLAYSVGIHALLITLGLGARLWQDHLASLKPRSVRIEMSFASPNEVGSAQRTGISSGSSRAAPGFADLLKQAALPGRGRMDHSGSAPDSRPDTRKMAERLRDGLLAGAEGLNPSAEAASRLETLKDLPAEKISLGKKSEFLTAEQKEAIRHAIAEREDAYRSCHERALLIDPELSGHATLLFGVGAAGRVQDSAQTRVAFEGKANESGRKAVETCLRQESLKLSFPKQAAGETIRFNLLLR